MPKKLVSLRWSVLLRPSGKWVVARVLLVRGRPFTLLPAQCGAPCRSRDDARAMAADLNRTAALAGTGEQHV